MGVGDQVREIQVCTVADFTNSSNPTVDSTFFSLTCILKAELGRGKATEGSERGGSVGMRGRETIHLLVYSPNGQS